MAVLCTVTRVATNSAMTSPVTVPIPHPSLRNRRLPLPVGSKKIGLRDMGDSAEATLEPEISSPCPRLPYHTGSNSNLALEYRRARFSTKCHLAAGQARAGEH